MHNNLNIDEEFKKLIPPLSNEEYKLLEENILKYGCIVPICTWNNTIVDGHNRYEICFKHNLEFKIKYFDFKCREEAKDWICTKQLGRRNISAEVKKYLIGKRYEMEKIILNTNNPNGKNQYSKLYEENKKIKEERDINHRPVTAIKLGKEYNVSARTVMTYANFAKAIDNLNEEEPDLTKKILTGEIKALQGQIIKMTQVSPKFKNKIKNYLNKKAEIQIKPSSKRKKNKNDKRFAIKDMPEYDPDAEISSLIFTIPSWIGSLDRVLSLDTYKVASPNAKVKLKQELKKLEFSIGTMLLALEE